jgi:hypothetical protein
MAENDAFGGMFAPKQAISREILEVIAATEKRLGRVQRAMLTYTRTPPRALLEEEEALRANLAHIRRRWGLTD